MARKLNTEEIIRLTPEEFKETPKIPLIVILDNVRSLHNVGSVFRTADAYCVKKVILCGITATPPNTEIHKSALGAEFSVDWAYYKETTEAVNELKQAGYTILAIEQAHDSINMDTFKAEKGNKYAVILGNEVKAYSNQLSI